MVIFMNLLDELLSFMVEFHPCSSPKLQELNHKEIALWKEIQAQVGVEKTERLRMSWQNGLI